MGWLDLHAAMVKQAKQARIRAVHDDLRLGRHPRVKRRYQLGIEHDRHVGDLSHQVGRQRGADGARASDQNPWPACHR